MPFRKTLPGSNLYRGELLFFKVLEGCNGGSSGRSDYSAVLDFPPSYLIFADENIPQMLIAAVGENATAHRISSVVREEPIFGLKRRMLDMDIEDIAFLYGGAYILSSDRDFRNYPRRIYIKQSSVGYKTPQLEKDLQVVMERLSQDFPEYSPR
ncbi:MAG: hypothetical protein JW727_06445 [Candidatus Aenigmarchaeota archaeon]|nr:hypothetical protein [Candidatus Aenigmarchaeota archaeon]